VIGARALETCDEHCSLVAAINRLVTRSLPRHNAASPGASNSFGKSLERCTEAVRPSSQVCQHWSGVLGSGHRLESGPPLGRSPLASICGKELQWRLILPSFRVRSSLSLAHLSLCSLATCTAIYRAHLRRFTHSTLNELHPLLANHHIYHDCNVPTGSEARDKTPSRSLVAVTASPQSVPVYHSSCTLRRCLFAANQFAKVILRQSHRQNTDSPSLSLPISLKAVVLTRAPLLTSCE